MKIAPALVRNPKLVLNYIIFTTQWSFLATRSNEDGFRGPAVDPPCKFLESSYVSICMVTLMENIPIETTVMVNHCHMPIDVTFFLKSLNPPLDWKYTFVTTNIIENLEIPGLSLDKPVTLHVDMDLQIDKVHLQADFHVENKQDVTIVDTVIPTVSFEDCSKGRAQGGRIALGVLLTLLLLCLCGTILWWVFRKRKQTQDGTALVDDMEVATANECSSHPLSPGTASTTSTHSQDFAVCYRPKASISIVDTSQLTNGHQALCADSSSSILRMPN